jgi:hypothetical protein
VEVDQQAPESEGQVPRGRVGANSGCRAATSPIDSLVASLQTRTVSATPVQDQVRPDPRDDQADVRNDNTLLRLAVWLADVSAEATFEATDATPSAAPAKVPPLAVSAL